MIILFRSIQIYTVYTDIYSIYTERLFVEMTPEWAGPAIKPKPLPTHRVCAEAFNFRVSKLQHPATQKDLQHLNLCLKKF